MSGFPPAVLSARFRVLPEDFVVDEELGFEADGEGEHVLVRVRKIGANTEWVARKLADFAGITPASVGFAGLKDRHAVTTQSFSLHLPGRADPDWSSLNEEGVSVLESARHRRKLPRGALRGNCFAIVLREVVGDHAAIEERLQRIAESGFPNFFGAQRFGRDGDNIAAAERWFSRGGRVTRTRRSMLLSSARSALFNAVLAERVEAGSWQHLQPGDVAVLAGSRSWFPVGDPVPADLTERSAQGDLHPSGPLWGRGVLPSVGHVAELERRVVLAHGVLGPGLEKAGLKQDRRALRARAEDLEWDWLEPSRLALRCRLDAGVYMTSLLGALGDVEEPIAERHPLSD